MSLLFMKNRYNSHSNLFKMSLSLCLPPGDGDALVSSAHKVNAHLSRSPSRDSVSSTLSPCLSPCPPTLCLLVGPAATHTPSGVEDCVGRPPSPVKPRPSPRSSKPTAPSHFVCPKPFLVLCFLCSGRCHSQHLACATSAPLGDQMPGGRGPCEDTGPPTAQLLLLLSSWQRLCVFLTNFCQLSMSISARKNTPE